MISLTFVRTANGSHGIVGRTTGFWNAWYGFELQHLPIFSKSSIMILNSDDCFFYYYQKYYFPLNFRRCFMKKGADFCRYYVFLLILIFCGILFIIWKRNLPPNANVFYPILPIAFTFVHVFLEIVKYLPQNAAELVRFLKTFYIRALWKK